MNEPSRWPARRLREACGVHLISCRRSSSGRVSPVRTPHRSGPPPRRLAFPRVPLRTPGHCRPPGSAQQPARSLTCRRPGSSAPRRPAFPLQPWRRRKPARDFRTPAPPRPACGRDPRAERLPPSSFLPGR